MKTQERIRAFRNFLFMGVFLFLSFTINAANAPITTVGPVCNAIPGQNITVPITVTAFNELTGLTLTLDYDPSQLQWVTGTYNPVLPGTCNIGERTLDNGFHRIKISWYYNPTSTDPPSVTLPDGSWVAHYVFKYISGPATLKFYEIGPSCAYNGPGINNVLNDSPTETYYKDGTIDGSCLTNTKPTISASGPTSFCEGGSVELTASAGSAYKWSPGGATTKSITVSASGSYTVEVTDATGGKATSEATVVTVNPSVPVSVSIQASANPVCAGTLVTYTPTPVNGGIPVYRWYRNNENVANTPTLSLLPENGDEVYLEMTSSLACPSSNPAISNKIKVVVNPILEAAVSIAAVPSEAVIAGTVVTFTASPVNGGLSPAYQWKVNGENKGANNPEFSFVPNNGDVVSCVMTSNATGCISGSPANSNEIAVPVISTGTTVLSYRFANPRIHKILGIDRFEFDVELKADVAGSKFLKGNVNLNFNNSTLSPIAADWIATPVSGSVTDLAVSGSNLNIELDVPNTLVLGASYQTLVTISSKITNGTGEAGIDFNEGNMNGKQFSKLAASPGLELYPSPNTYEGDDFVNTWVGRVFGKKYFWTQMDKLDWTASVNSSVWDGHALVPLVKASNVRIHKAGDLSIPSDSQLSVSGNTDIIPENGLIIESDANGTGSLITGTSSGSASVQRYMTTDAWHIVASPVSGQTIDNFLSLNTNVATDDLGARGMMDYDPLANDWNNYFTDGTNGTKELETGKGFSMRTNANSAVTFSGTLHSGNQTAIGLTPALWNCVGNPYTSAIGINEGSSSTANFLTVNADNLDPKYGAIYVWDQPDANNGTWGIYTVISNVSDPFLPPLSLVDPFHVQQGQAFMVKMSSLSTEINFTPAMQVHIPGLELKSTEAAWPTIKLEASVNNQTSSTLIAFNAGMSKGLDPTYDAGLLRGSSDLVLYSKLVQDNGIPFAIQALPANDFETMIIPIGIESKTGGEVVFSSRMVNLPADCQVILEDRQSHAFTDLSINEYRTGLPANSSISDRFQLHTSYLSTKLVQETLAGNLSAYAVRNTEIRINGLVSNQAVATLYDVQGRVVLAKTLEEGSLNVMRTPNIKTAIYLLSVQDHGQTARFKIPVNE